MNTLKYQLVMQQSGTKVLVQKANVFQIMIADSKSPQVQSAIEGVMEAVDASKVCQDKVTRAFKAAVQQVREQQEQRLAVSTSEKVLTPKCAVCSESRTEQTTKTEGERTSKGPARHDEKLPRADAEAKYAKLLDSLATTVESLEKAVQAAPNTKLNIKTAVKKMGADFRDFSGHAKQLGLTRNPDALEISARQLQQQQAQQHALTLKLLREIREEQVRQNLTTVAGTDFFQPSQGTQVMAVAEAP